MATCSHITYILNGVETSRYDNEYQSTKLTAVAPTEGDDGYYVEPVEGVDHYVVYLNSQLTAYDDNNEKIANMAGLTWYLDKQTITENFEDKIFDLFESAEIINNTAHEIGYELGDDKVLKVYTGRSANYLSGWITLQVNQYAADGTILAVGNLRIHTFAEPPLNNNM